jgi:hypothetical protein
MLYREVMAICSQIHTTHINTLCGLNVEFVNVKQGGTYSDNRTLECKSFKGSDYVHCELYAYVM